MRWLLLAALACVVSVLWAGPQRKPNKKEEETQTLQVPKELPTAVVGETRRLTFRVTPLSSKGLLSQQIRDALKAVSRDAGGETVLKIRAFVAGSGDVRRVRDLVSEFFAERRQPLPALSLIHTGGLPLDGAQVIFEYVSAARKEVNPQGLAFISAQSATADDPLAPVAPLTTQSLAALRGALAAAAIDAADVLRVTCFFSSLENLGESRKQVEAAYPRAALNYVQTERVPSGGTAACEAVGRLRHAPASALEFTPSARSGDDTPAAALVGARQVVLTGSQVSFGFEEKDARLAFERLKKAVEQAGGSLRDVAFAHYYPLAYRIAAQVRTVRADFFGRVPAGSSLIFESLPSMDAGFAVDVVAVKPQ
jgi:enamine deaminase RidA (YjgF/YER057c/UK114 family)